MTVDFTEEEKEYISFPSVWQGEIDDDCPDDLRQAITAKVESYRKHDELREKRSLFLERLRNTAKEDVTPEMKSEYLELFKINSP